MDSAETTRPAVLAKLEAGTMPMATEIGSVARHDDHVADADSDVVIATRAEVHLARFVGLHPPHLVHPIAQRGNATQTNSSATTIMAAATNT